MDKGADTAVRMVAPRGLSRACGRRDLPLTVQQHGPIAHEGCAAKCRAAFLPAYQMENMTPALGHALDC